MSRMLEREFAVPPWFAAAALAVAALLGGIGGGWHGARLAKEIARNSACQFWCDNHARALGLPEYLECLERCEEWRCD